MNLPLLQQMETGQIIQFQKCNAGHVAYGGVN